MILISALWKRSLLSWLMNTGIKVVIALLILVVSYKIINLIARRIEKKNKANPNPKLDKTIVAVLLKAGKAVLKAVIAYAS